MPRLAALLLALLSSIAHAQEFRWPGGAKLAVTLSYDDALNSQLDNAIPQLNAAGLRGTFYLTMASDVVAKRLPEWRQAAAQGHELGNHTLFHACSRSGPGRDWVELHRDLDKIPVANIRQEILVANEYLYAIDGKRQRTLTLPCFDKLAAGQNYVPAVASEFVAIKSKGGGLTLDITAADPKDIGTEAPSEVSGQELIDMVTSAAAKAGQGRALLSFTFHGVGGDHLKISREAHEALLKHLASRPDLYWVDSFVNIMQHVDRFKRPSR